MKEKKDVLDFSSSPNPEILDNLAKTGLQKSQKSKEPNRQTKRDRQPLASGQTSRWLDYAAHCLQNIGQALQPLEPLDTC